MWNGPLQRVSGYSAPMVPCKQHCSMCLMLQLFITITGVFFSSWMGRCELRRVGLLVPVMTWRVTASAGMQLDLLVSVGWTEHEVAASA